MPFHLFGSWIDIQDKLLLRLRGDLNVELLREVNPSHPLYEDLHGPKSLGFVAVAKCDRCDKVIFKFKDGRFAAVHLTWADQTSRPKYPVTEVLDSEDSINEWMRTHQCGWYDRPFIDRDDGHLLDLDPEIEELGNLVDELERRLGRSG